MRRIIITLASLLALPVAAAPSRESGAPDVTRKVALQAARWLLKQSPAETTEPSLRRVSIGASHHVSVLHEHEIVGEHRDRAISVERSFFLAPALAERISTGAIRAEVLAENLRLTNVTVQPVGGGSFVDKLSNWVHIYGVQHTSSGGVIEGKAHSQLQPGWYAHHHPNFSKEPARKDEPSFTYDSKSGATIIRRPSHLGQWEEAAVTLPPGLKSGSRLFSAVDEASHAVRDSRSWKRIAPPAK